MREEHCDEKAKKATEVTEVFEIKREPSNLYFLSVRGKGKTDRLTKKTGTLS